MTDADEIQIHYTVPRGYPDDDETVSGIETVTLPDVAPSMLPDVLICETARQPGYADEIYGHGGVYRRAGAALRSLFDRRDFNVRIATTTIGRTGRASELETGPGSPYAYEVLVTVESSGGAWSDRAYAACGHVAVVLDDDGETLVYPLPGGELIVRAGSLSERGREATRFLDTGDGVAGLLARVGSDRWGRVGWRAASSGGRPDDGPAPRGSLVASLGSS